MTHAGRGGGPGGLRTQRVAAEPGWGLQGSFSEYGCLMKGEEEEWLYEKPKPGDLIQVFQVGYEHWAIYVGGGDVIHLAPKQTVSLIPCVYPRAGSSSTFFIRSTRAVVKQERLQDVVAGCHYRVNNYLDHAYTPQPVKKVIRSVKEKIGEEVVYCVRHKDCKHFFTYVRYGTVCGRQLGEVPEPGDLINISHIGYEHWAIYVGDGDVIHLTPIREDSGAGSSSTSSILSSRAVVKQEQLKDVAGGCFYQINNYLGYKHRPRPANKIIRCAKEKIGKEVEYCVLRRNSEHLVTHLRYGTAYSREVGPLGVVLLPPGGQLGVGVTGLCNRWASPRAGVLRLEGTESEEEEFYEVLEPGDWINISHVGYEHWAIYAGGGNVIHLAPKSKESWAGSSRTVSIWRGRALVKKEQLKDVVGSCFYQHRPRPVNRIISSAKEKIGEQVEYCDLPWNSEHFVTHLRYGTAYSRQFCKEPEPGDLIEIFHIGFEHWAIYVGGGDVIHLAPIKWILFVLLSCPAPSLSLHLLALPLRLKVPLIPGECHRSGSSSRSTKTVVKQERLQDVVGGDRYQEKIGEEVEYCFLSKNCGRFVTHLRNGRACSRQVCLEWGSAGYAASGENHYE
ncbi:hypothetical protein HPG69_016004 [Diceros bicornis minor]|uniref:LRAT domain-containing protein n=1 Tax=Diceros bicornis minor TaxID=77932 RepID=A0A7J7FDI8_DICBM|nr:hypothetical protein HPG69_016004 [Diceros bicornis minor]